MERTIALLREKAPNTKIMVGGAVLTNDYAQKIGADGYAKDAMSAVKLAEKLTK
jgi:5-methyltetrahydrofolate--homocysteine methyltransferase